MSVASLFSLSYNLQDFSNKLDDLFCDLCFRLGEGVVELTIGIMIYKLSRISFYTGGYND